MPTLHWIGKDKIVNHHLDVPYRVLNHKYGFKDGEQSDEETNSGNMIIQGDNLDALKALLPKYEGRIKCIYIDPPYNTGNEGWIYNDNVNDPKIKKWLGDTVGPEGEDLSRHDKWLCMMYPRLRLLHKLLKDDGAIFISIDDNEQASLKLVMDEIFGANNFATTFIWEKRTTRENRRIFSFSHDFVLCYAKNLQLFETVRGTLPLSDEVKGRYVNPDNDLRGDWQSVSLNAQAGHATTSQFYTIVTPSGRRIDPPKGRCWSVTEVRLKILIAENRVWFGPSGNNSPRLKKFLSETTKGLTPHTLWKSTEVGTTDSAAKDILKLFDGEAKFDTPKPYQLIERILQIAANSQDIILDSFAGSGTAAHAVFNLNKQDGGNRKFILVELGDYADSITAERNKRVIQGYGDTEGTGGAFDFYDLGAPLFKDAENLNEEIGIEKIREYVWYTETQKPMQDGPHKNTHFLGSHLATDYYFFYEKDAITTLDYAFLATFENKAESYIIYADQCALTEKYLLKHGIIFKKIPRDISKI
jgi:adenine-specific DNA-methyltransferase